MCAEYQRLQDAARELPYKYHAHGTRRKVIHLPGGDDVILNLTYFLPPKERSGKGVAEAAARLVSGADAAGHFQRTDSAGSPTHGKGISTSGIV